MTRTRREATALGIAALLVGAGARSAIGGIANGAASVTHVRPSLADNLAAILGDADSAVGVGRAFLEARPEEGDLEGLVRRIVGRSPELEAHLERRQVEDARRVLLARHRADWAEARMVRVKGWLLSETEARMCALAALIRS